MSNENLHDLVIPGDGFENSSRPQQDYSIKVASPDFDSIEVLFRHQERRLLELITEFQDGGIFGCIAWLTSFPVLKALGECKNVSIMVQKEDFLRPDLNTQNFPAWKTDLWHLYHDISCDIERHQFLPPMGNLSVAHDPVVDGIRCIGNYNADKRPAFPRAHHKFLVFCKVLSDDYSSTYTPVGLWTGSFNITKNSTQSFENALYFADSSGSNPIIQAYLQEHHQLFGLSEPLDWENEWTTPEFRIGT
jgi:hypothetical protein